MFKVDNTHHPKNIAIMKKFKKGFAVIGMAETYGTYGLTVAAAANNYITIADAPYVFRVDRDWTFEFNAEVNSTNKSGTRYIFTYGRQGSSQNYITCGFVNGVFRVNIYDNSSAMKQWNTATDTITNLSNGLHKFAVMYSRTGPTVTIVVDGVELSTTTTGTGTGLITANTANTRYLFGADSWGSLDTTGGHFTGDIANIHYSPFCRSKNNCIKRQLDPGRLFPIDKYSAIDWNYRNKLKGWSRVFQSTRKYGEV